MGLSAWLSNVVGPRRLEVPTSSAALVSSIKTILTEGEAPEIIELGKLLLTDNDFFNGS